MSQNQILGFESPREFMVKSNEFLSQIKNTESIEDEYFHHQAVKQIEDEKKFALKNIFTVEKSPKDFDLLDQKVLSDARSQIKEINNSKKPEITHFTDKIHQIDK